MQAYINTETLTIIIIAVIIALLIGLFIVLLFMPKNLKHSLEQVFSQTMEQAGENNERQNLLWQNTLRQELLSQLSSLKQEFHNSLLATRQAGIDQARADRTEVRQVLEGMAGMQSQRLGEIRGELDKVLNSVGLGLDKMRQENSAKLEEMRQTVDEKLANTLEKRLGESFMQVSSQLEQVHKSVGEMQNLAVGVGDLKKVLSNVKTRGTWGEIQLGNLLEDIFTCEQLAYNVEIKPGSNERVEFALRMPGRDEAEVLLPLDAKFPREDYERLLAASENADKSAEEAALKALEQSIRKSAKDIRDKYICPPYSTEAAVMFLPTEGLYAEVLRRPGLMDSLQREYKVLAAGPSSLSALLTCLQMGFRTLAIEQKASEVWRVLGAIKTEFGKYGQAMESLRRKLQGAEKDLDKIVIRQRAINRKLTQVESLPQEDAQTMLGLVAPALQEDDFDDQDLSQPED